MSQTIQAIFIKQTETRKDERGKQYTAYRIDVQAPVRQWHLWKRYSDFTRLHDQLVQTFPTNVPPANLPQKRIFPPTFNTPEKVENRRHGLENYIRTIQSCRDDRWRKTEIWASFLALPELDDEKRLQNLDLNGGGGEKQPVFNSSSWLDEYEELNKSARHIRSLLNSRASHLTLHEISDAMQCEVKVKKEIMSLTARLENLERSLLCHNQNQDLAQGEQRRRQDKLDALKDDKNVLVQLVNVARQEKVELVRKSTTAQQQQKNKKNEEKNYGDIGFTQRRASEDSFYPHNQQQQQQPFQHKPSIGKGRAFGVALQKQIQETEVTRGLDNQQLIDYQNQTMKDQDLHMEQFSQILARQKEIGVAISFELDNHIDILNDLDCQVEKTATKLQFASKKLAKIN